MFICIILRNDGSKSSDRWLTPRNNHLDMNLIESLRSNIKYNTQKTTDCKRNHKPQHFKIRAINP